VDVVSTFDAAFGEPRWAAAGQVGEHPGISSSLPSFHLKIACLGHGIFMDFKMSELGSSSGKTWQIRKVQVNKGFGVCNDGI
jgi:hypothetical protein